MPSGAYALTKGKLAEQAVARYLRENGFPLATTHRAALGRNGVCQESDIVGVAGMSIEVKNRSRTDIGAALKQAAAQCEDGKVPLLVMKPIGVGYTSVGDWWGITFMRDLIPMFPIGGDL